MQEYSLKQFREEQIKLSFFFKTYNPNKTYFTQTIFNFCIATELSGLLKIRQNTAIYGYVPRTAEVLCTQHKGNRLFLEKKLYGLIFVNKINKI